MKCAQLPGCSAENVNAKQKKQQGEFCAPSKSLGLFTEDWHANHTGRDRRFGLFWKHEQVDNRRRFRGEGDFDIHIYYMSQYVAELLYSSFHLPHPREPAQGRGVVSRL